MNHRNDNSPDMYKEKIVIDGDSFSTLDSFYDEVERKLTKDLDWNIGRNLDAFNDILNGGFGVFDYEEPAVIIWRNSEKSRRELGWDETIQHLQRKLLRCHPSNKSSVEEDLRLARDQKGQTIFELLIDIIRTHNHLQLQLL